VGKKRAGKKRVARKKREPDVTLTVIRKPVTLSGTPDTAMTEDVAEAGWTLTASGGIPPYTATLSGGTPITGITAVGGSSPAFTINAGTPTVPGTYPQTIRVRDSQLTTVFLDFTVTVASLLGDITVAASASRLSGTAPLYVHFDGTATAAATLTDYPFHELDYSWDFDDVGAGSWTYGINTDKNKAYGPVAAHVFETAGTYTVTLSVTDGDQTSTNGDNPITIVVADPDTTFAGTATVCVSNDTDWTGAPSGSNNVTSSDFDAMLVAHGGAGKRVLFKRDDTFSCSAQTTISGVGPYTVGAFGSGAKPIVQMTGGIVSTNAVFARGSNSSNFRVMDLNFDGNGFPCRIMSGNTATSDYLLLRLEATGMARLWANDGYNGGVYASYAAMVDCDTELYTGGQGNVAFFTNGCNGFAIMGCRVYDTTAIEHIARLQAWSKLVVTNNHFQRPSGDLTGSFGKKSCLIVSCRANIVYSPGKSQYGVVRDNIMLPDDGGAGITISGADAAGQVEDLLVESNYVESTPTMTTGISIRKPLRCTIRNNFIKGLDTITGVNVFMFQIVNGELEPSPVTDYVWIYNNSGYHAGTPTGAYILSQAADGGGNNIGNNCFMYNNVLYAPNAATTPSDIIAYSPSGLAHVITTATNSTPSQIKNTSPLYANASGNFNVVTDFHLGALSYAKESGTAVPIIYDAERTLRGATFDLGAYED
jgi:hypothetical protein